MRKLVVYEMVSLDGFIGDRQDSAGWSVQDPEVAKYAQNSGTPPVEAFLFGRVTYGVLAAFWPTPEGEKANKFYADSLNNTPKVVVSRSLERPAWQNTRVEKDFSRSSMEALKREGDGAVMVFGSGTLVGPLLAWGLVDEMQLLVNPVVLGEGKRLFNDSGPMQKLSLTDTRAFPSGIVLLKYAPS